ncbi:MAG: hypothetical protein HQL64_03705 [Magnetococcales bacterium]|nr:hypothetical protein [Magnetococcales bacterium]
MLKNIGALLVFAWMLQLPAMVWAQGEVLQRKAALVDQLLKDSDTSKRIAAKGDAEARTMLDQAGQIREEARHAVAAGDEKKGIELLDKALKLVTTASRNSVDPAKRQWLHKSRYEDLLVSVTNFKDAYARHLKRLKPGEKGPLDVDAVETLHGQATALGKEQKFVEANALLERAHGMVVTGLTALLGSTALVYELKFDTPKDEYEYEVKRGESYEAMIRMMLLEEGSKKTDEKQLQPLLDKSQESGKQAGQKAAAGQFADAIKNQEEANNLLAQVLRMLGVMIPM